MGLAGFTGRRLRRLLNAPVEMTDAEGEPWDKDRVGREGEDLAALFLRSEGMTVLYRNFRASLGGEVDIVCRDRNTLVFVEVKTRTSREFGRPIDAVTMDKQHLITRGAMGWLRLLDFPPQNYRFDVVEVVLAPGEPPDLHLVRNAFETPEPFIY